jgi:hypothetical protein
VGNGVIRRVELDEIDDIEACATQEAEQLAVWKLPLHSVFVRPLKAPQPALRPLQRFSRRAFIRCAQNREGAVAKKPEPSTGSQ